MQRSMSRELTAFSLYLRTGRLSAPADVPIDVEVKYNPWHDDQTGRFTFVGQGRYFGTGRHAGSLGLTQAGTRQRLDEANRHDRLTGDDIPDRSRNRADHPDNFAFYTVQPGDSLARIAARRKGLTASGLAWLNQQALDQPLKVGQRIKLPHQAYLDAGRTAKNKLLGLAHYMDTNGGKLPPNVAEPPPLTNQILDSNWKLNRKNGHDFHIDAIARTREIVAEITNGPIGKRSRRNQIQAGQPDRRSGDDGGHFIAARFNGSDDSVNHFAQDRNFNRGAYRAMEDDWAKDLRADKKVVVDIVPLYKGISRRPYSLTVKWYVDGKKRFRTFANEAKGAFDGQR